MAFDVTEPTDNTKIRDLGVVIRPNWVAINTADSSFQPQALNLTDRDSVAPPIASDPTALAAGYTLFCKQDSGGDPQLFGIDTNSNILQFTGIAPLLASDGYVFLPGNLLLQWFTFSVKNDDINNFPIDFAIEPYCIVGSQVSDEAVTYDFIKPIIIDKSTFKTIVLKASGSAQNNPSNCSFFCIGKAQT